MKIISYISLLSITLCAQSYTFLVNKYDKEIELESKIISKIADAFLSKKTTLYIPKITQNEKNIYNKIFKLGKTCEDSDFIFVKRNIEDKHLCLNKEKIYFTNNYKKLLFNENYIGAFFWSKNRPNIVFIKKRLVKQNITLHNDYKQFIEDI